MSDRVILVGLDAVSPELLESGAASGRLPAVRRLLETGVAARVVNPPGLWEGAVWPSLATGLSPAGHGRYSYRQLVPGRYLDAPSPPAANRGTPFWTALASAAKRVAVVDVPKTAPIADARALQVIDWAGHDRDYDPPVFVPASLRSDVVRRFGDDPVGPCDRERLSVAAFVRFRDALLRRIAAKRDLALWLLGEHELDLLVLVFADGHCAGHQAWHLHDSGHAMHDPALTAAAGDPIADVLGALDRALTAILDRSQPTDTVFLYASHGMGPATGVAAAIDEVVRRLAGAPPRPPASNGAPPALRAVWRRLPSRLRRTLAPWRERWRARRAATDWRALSQLRFFPVPNNDVCPALRCNVVGREPSGLVTPGGALATLLDELSGELLALADADTGEPMVGEVVRCADVFRGPHLAALPDLVVEPRGDRVARALASPRLGVVPCPPPSGRTGAHRRDGLLVAMVPGVRRSGCLPPLAVTDIAPTLAARLGVELADVDGRPIPSLLPGAST